MPHDYEYRLRLCVTDPIWPNYRRYYHLALLLVWLIRYMEYLFTATLAYTTCAGAKGANSTNAGSTGFGALGTTLVDDVLLGVILAYIYRSVKTRLRHEKVVYATLFVELLLETALVLYYVIHLFVDKSGRKHFGLVMWHDVWIIHLSLIIYKLQSCSLGSSSLSTGETCKTRRLHLKDNRLDETQACRGGPIRMIACSSSS